MIFLHVYTSRLRDLHCNREGKIPTQLLTHLREHKDTLADVVFNLLGLHERVLVHETAKNKRVPSPPTGLPLCERNLPLGFCRTLPLKLRERNFSYANTKNKPHLTPNSQRGCNEGNQTSIIQQSKTKKKDHKPSQNSPRFRDAVQSYQPIPKHNMNLLKASNHTKQLQEHESHLSSSLKN